MFSFPLKKKDSVYKSIYPKLNEVLSYFLSWWGRKTPFSVTIPPVMSWAGVTSKEGFQQLMP